MRKTYMVTLLSACLLSACGGSDNSSQPPEPAKSLARQISFGDNFSDVGTYAVGKVKELGGGKYTINGNNTQVNPALTGQIWVEQLAQKLGFAAPCAAQTGLEGNAAMGFSVPVENHDGCFAYAQGGARVTAAEGPSNKASGDDLGALTVPVKTQISRHLALSGGKFQADDLVLVMAGGNDLLVELDEILDNAEDEKKGVSAQAYDTGIAKALAGGAADPKAAEAAILKAASDARAMPGAAEGDVLLAALDTAAKQPGNAGIADPKVYRPLVDGVSALSQIVGQMAANGYILNQKSAVEEAMSTAGRELAALVKNEILAKGARHVVVNNIPDVSLTPAGRQLGPQVQLLLETMAKAFNQQLESALEKEPYVALVDMYELTQEAAKDPAKFGLSNVTDMACALSDQKNPLENVLVCNASSLNAGDVSHYAYADNTQPTPFFHNVLADYVKTYIEKKGWL